MEGKKVKAILRWFKGKKGFEDRTEITGRYLGIMYYGSYGCDDGVATDTCLLVVDDLTGRIAEIGVEDITFLE